ncbi:MAG: hypothetical protein CL828_09610 [Crocinitomicaceae bacterium]|nr:hypothetical protein [Crocinitomicaceae bacterium]
MARFHFSAAHQRMEAFDPGPDKAAVQSHVRLLEPELPIFVNIDGLHAGVGCANSWGALPFPAYQMPFIDYRFHYRIEAVSADCGELLCRKTNPSSVSGPTRD